MHTVRSCCSIGAYWGILLPSRAGTKILVVLSLCCLCHSVWPIPSRVTGTSNSNRSPAWKMLRILVFFTRICAFPRWLTALIPSSTRALSLPGDVRDRGAMPSGEYKSSQLPYPYKGLHLFYILRYWTILSLINHSFWNNMCLTQPNDSQNLLVVPGPWIFWVRHLSSSHTDVPAKPAECPAADRESHVDSILLMQWVCFTNVEKNRDEAWATIPQ